MNSKIIYIVCMVFCVFLSSCRMDYNLQLNKNNVEEKLFLGISGEGNLEMVKEAVKDGADIDVFHSNGLKERIWDGKFVNSPILIAMFNGNRSIVNYMLECGVNVNYCNKSNRTILSYCAEYDNEYLSKFIELGADTDINDKKGYTPLDYAVKNKNIESIDILIKHGAKISQNTFNILLEQMYENSYIEDNYKIMNILLVSGSCVILDTDIKNAFLGNSSAVIEYLRLKNWQNERFEIIASAIAAFCDKECLNYLLVNTDVLNKINIEHLFRMSAMFGNEENMNYLINLGCDVNARNKEDYTALELAVKNNKVKTVKYLQNLNVDFHPSKTNNERDALYNAVKNNNLEMIEILLSYTGYFNVTQAVILAIENHNMDILKYFLDNGVDVNTNNDAGTNLLGKAILVCDLEMVKYLIERGADIEDPKCEYPLCYAAKEGNIPIMQYLINNDSDVNAVRTWADNSRGESPLIQAIKYGQLEAVKLLIESGADIYQDFYGNNIVEYAKHKGSDNIHNYLKEIYYMSE